MDKSKYSNNFRVHFDGFGSGEAVEHLSQQVANITRPTVAFYDVLGMEEFDAATIKVTLNDDVSDRTRAEVVSQLRKQITNDATFSMVIETLSAERSVLEQWRFNRCRIVDCQFSELKQTPVTALVVLLTIRCGQISSVQSGREVNLV